MARASTYTLLSLDRYAKIMGISPLHFNGGVTPGLTPQVFPLDGCSGLWYQYDWQKNDQTSREQLALAIAEVEKEIAEIIKYYPAPVWIEEEVHSYPRHHMRNAYGNSLDVRLKPKAIATDYGRIVSPGRRGTSLIGTATVAGGELVYSDNDSDGYYETATIILPTTVTDSREVKVYFAGHDASEEWEIRYPRSVTISGGNVTIVLDSWLIINPDLWEIFPTDDGIGGIDVTTTVNFIQSVEVYREYVDTSQSSSEFIWERSGHRFLCSSDVCSPITQDGCLSVADYRNGIVIPVPAEYDASNKTWKASSFSECCEPDLVKLWYYAGERSQEYIKGKSLDPLPYFWAQTIAWMATARLERPVCGCTNTLELFDELRTDLIKSQRGEAGYYVSEEIINCPFGTRKGEVIAWKRIKSIFKNKRLGVAVL